MRKVNLKKKVGAGILATAMVISMVPIDFANACVGFRPGDSNNGVVTTNTPTSAANTQLKWQTSLGSGWSASPTPPTIVGDYAYVAAGNKLYRLNKETGVKVAPTAGLQLAGDVGFSTNPMASDGNNLYIQIGNGKIEKVEIKNGNELTLAHKWTWSDSAVKGQTISPVIYHDGYIYSGTWKGENRPSAYFCVNAATGQKAWVHQNSNAGYYWAGAYVDDNYAYFGSDSGDLVRVNAKTGEDVRTLHVGNEQIRSTIVKYGSNLYFTTKSGNLYKVSISAIDDIDSDSTENFTTGYGKYAHIGNMATGTPVIVDNVVYIGASGESQFDATSGHTFQTLDADTLDPIESVSSPGYPQAAPLVKDGANENYAYFTYNASPGGMKVLKTNNAGTIDSNSYQDLFVPGAAGQQYCICPVMTDNAGNLYYKNDSGYVFCLGSTTPAAVDGLNGITTTAGTLSPAFDADTTNYTLALPNATTSFNLTLDLADGATATVDGTNYTGTVNVSLGTNLSKDISIAVVINGTSKTYSIHAQRESNAMLTSLVIKDDHNSTKTLTPSFASDVLNYEAQWTEPVKMLERENGTTYRNPKYVEYMDITVTLDNNNVTPTATITAGKNAIVTSSAPSDNGEYTFRVTFAGNTTIDKAAENYTPMMLVQQGKFASDVELTINVGSNQYTVQLPRSVYNMPI